MRNDTYAIYNRKEYRIFLSEGMAELISNDVKDLSNGLKNIGLKEIILSLY